MNATLTPTRHNLLTDGIKDRSKQMADYFLTNFKWSLPQMRILMQLADNGYIISKMNPVLTTFGKPAVSDDKMQIIICGFVNNNTSKFIKKKGIEFIAL